MIAFIFFTIASIVLPAYGEGLTDSVDDICARGSSDVCQSPHPGPVGFPESIEALDKMCQQITARMSCLLDFQNKCGVGYSGSMDEQMMSNIYKVTLDACDKDSDLHQDLASSLPCLKVMLDNHRNSCQPIVEEAMASKASRRFLESGASGEDGVERRRHFCLFEALDIACLVARASVTCGSETKELIGRILVRIDYLDTVCDADVIEEVKGLMEIMVEETEDRLAFGRIFPRE